MAKKRSQRLKSPKSRSKKQRYKVNKRVSAVMKTNSWKKTPRLCREDRLVRRFYEPLLLLQILDRNGERRIFRCPSDDSTGLSIPLQEFRRVFLDQLAYVCDYVKGGDTVTAIAMESQPSGVNFYISSNTGPSSQVVTFLEELLTMLQEALSPSAKNWEILEAKVGEKCLEFNVKRVKVYEKLLQKPLISCLNLLAHSKAPEDAGTLEWLRKFRSFGPDLKALCRFAYRERSCQYMKELQKYIGDSDYEVPQMESRRNDFIMSRHYIGRLGSHLKAARIITAAGLRLPRLFESFTIIPLPSPRAPSLLPPADGLTTLDGIVVRMLPAGSKDVPKYQESLGIMDKMFNIEERLRSQYDDKDFKPRVHAELNLLEFFYRDSLTFVDNDRFIGCSKPACYCCYHYISLHPGDFVRPASHGIRYINWRQPDPFNSNDEEEKKHRRDILNKLIAQIRLDVFHQISERRGPSPWRPDSTTGLTSSVPSVIPAEAIRYREYVSRSNMAGIASDRPYEHSLTSSTRAAVNLADSEDDSSDSGSEGGVILS